MKSARSFKEFEALNGISMEEVLTVFEAVSEAFPMIVAANLTKNTYTMIKDDGFLANDMPSSGKYDDLIDVGKHTPELPACVSGQFLQGTSVTDAGAGTERSLRQAVSEGTGRLLSVGIHTCDPCERQRWRCVSHLH